MGNYAYGAGNAGPHAVTTAGSHTYTYDAAGNLLTGAGRTLAYTPFNKVKSIVKGNHTLSFAYGPGRARFKRTDTDNKGTVLDSSDDTTVTTLYLGSVEQVTYSNSRYDYKRYIAGGAALITETHETTVKNGVSSETETGTTQYLLRDHLGSISVITDALGVIVQALSYDAWGQRRNGTTWGDLSALALGSFDTSRTPRGYTGHEMLDAVGIVHMNGRIYDPTLGRFMQADPVIQFPDFSQSHNRYSYVLNNPLAYTDPSGYIIPVFSAIAAGVAVGFKLKLVVTAALIGLGVFADSLVQGVPLDKAFLAGVSAGALTAVAVGTVPGNFGLNLATAGHVATVATFGGITTSLQGGKFGHGFLSAGLGSAAPALPGLRGLASAGIGGRALVSAVSAGTISEITGGKFANGALTAAFVALVSSAAQAARLNGRNSSPNDPILTPEQRADLAKRQGLAVDDINAAYESGALGDGRGFNTIDEASKEVLGVIDPISRRHQVEIGGFIFPSGEEYVYGRPIVGTGSSIPGLVNVPDSAVAGFHTHPSGARYFSISDVIWVNGGNGITGNNIPLYLAGNGQIRVCAVSSWGCNYNKALFFPENSRNPGLQGRIVQ